MVGQPSLILASSSPRRQQILSALGAPFDVVVADVDESPFPDEPPEQLARRLAEMKARVAAQRFPGRVAIGADTVVALGDRTLGKPTSPDEAVRTLRELRGVEHRVITAVSGAQDGANGTNSWTDVGITRVWMRDYSDEEIAAYVATGDPLDKAGSYAIQHPIFRPVARVEGCYLTVVGLSLAALRSVLEQARASLPPIDATTIEAMCPGCNCATG